MHSSQLFSPPLFLALQPQTDHAANISARLALVLCCASSLSYLPAQRLGADNAGLPTPYPPPDDILGSQRTSTPIHPIPPRFLSTLSDPRREIKNGLAELNVRDTAVDISLTDHKRS